MVDLALNGNQTAYRPGATVHGTVRWFLLDPPASVELRLFWFTRGKGTEDVKVVETTSFDSPAAEASLPFQVRLPAEPYSYAGRLIAIIWAIEVVAKPGGETARIEITVSPTGQEVKPG